MDYQYTRIDGERVEAHVAAAYRRLDSAFKAKWGMGLLVASGTRTRAEQAELRRRYLNGTGNLAAPPGYSNHEESGPIGPRALDLWDHGTDPGVRYNGTPRANWLKANAPKYGFSPAGYNFSQREPWHYEFTGSLTGGVPATIEEDDVLNAADKKWLKREIARAVWTYKSAVNGRKFGDMLRTLWNANRRGSKGNWHHGENTNDYLTRLGRIENQNEALIAAVKTLANSQGVDGEAVVQQVAKSVDKALADLSITLETAE